jgi:hypothetical protein
LTLRWSVLYALAVSRPGPLYVSRRIQGGLLTFEGVGLAIVSDYAPDGDIPPKAMGFRGALPGKGGLA